MRLIQRRLARVAIVSTFPLARIGAFGHLSAMLVKRKPKKPTEAHHAVAREVMDGKSFRAAMVENGFGPKYAAQGPQHVRKMSAAFNQAFLAEAKRRDVSDPELQAVARHRLYTNVVNGKDLSPRSIEMIGRLKNVDMFVRTGDIQVGVFQQFAGDVGARDVEELKALVIESGIAPPADKPEEKQA